MTAADIILNISHGINWVSNELAKLRIKTTQGMAAAINDPRTGGWALLGIISGATLLEIAINAISQVKLIKDIADFIGNIGQTIKNVLSLMHLDLLITLFLIGKSFDKDWQKSLASIYEALGNISKEIGKDVSFINAFAEVNRSLLTTFYSLSDNQWLRSQSEYATGITKYLQGIQDRMLDYVDNPDLIFQDLAATISEGKQNEIATRLGNITAAIDLAAQWIKDKGTILINGIEELYSITDKFPDEVAKAIHAQVDPYKHDFDVFIKGSWDPFWKQYDMDKRYLVTYLNGHDVRLEEIEAKIDDPLSWLKALLSLPPDQAEESLDLIYRTLGERPTTAALEGTVAAGDTIINVLTVEAPPVESLPPAVPGTVVHSPVTLFGDVKTTTPNKWFVGETSSDPYPAGGQRADGRSWFVGEVQ